MTKERSESQRIGSIGENYIPYWASQHSSTAQKMGEDYGFDFAFQVLESNKFLGKTFVAQCKAVEKGERKYLTLEKDDLFLHLTSNSPVCLLGVDLEDGKVKEVKFLFLDNDLVDRYCKSIKADHKTLSINFDELHNDSSIENESKIHCSPQKRQQVLLYTVKKMLEIYAPGVDVTSYFKDNMNVLGVKGTLLTDILKPSFVFNPTDKNQLKNILNPDILEVLKKYYPNYNALMISGLLGFECKFSFDAIETVAICYKSASSLCYRTKAGFVLSAGPEKEGLHNMIFTLEDSPYSLPSCDEDCSFFESYNNSTLRIDGSPFVDNIPQKWPMLDIFFNLAKETVFLMKGKWLNFDNFYLKELNNDSSRFLIHFLYTIYSGKEMVMPFAIGVNPNDYDKLIYTEKTRGVLPIEFSFDHKKYLLSCDCEYRKVIFNTEIHGAVIENVCNPKIKEIGISEFFAESPRMLIASTWPPLPIDIDPASGAKITFRYDDEKRNQYLMSED